MVKLVSPEAMAPFALNVLRAGVCTLLLWALYLVRHRDWKPMQRKHVPRLLACAASGITINQLLFIKGLTMSTAIHGALLMLVTPLLISLLAIFFLSEKLYPAKVLGLLMGGGGAALLIIMRGQPMSATDSAAIFWGDVLIICNAVSYSLYFILVKPLMQVYPPIQIITWLFTLGGLMMLPFGLGDLAATDFTTFLPKHWWALSFVVLGATFLAYIFNIYGVHQIGPSATSTYMYTQPVFATLLAIGFYGEEMDWIKAASAGMIFAGVYLVNRKPRTLMIEE